MNRSTEKAQMVCEGIREDIKRGRTTWLAVSRRIDIDATVKALRDRRDWEHTAQDGGYVNERFSEPEDGWWHYPREW